MQFRNRFTPVLTAIGVSLFFMMLIRLFLWLRYPASFSDLSTNETLMSFLLGMRIDLIAVLTFTLLLILLSTLPLRLVFNNYFRATVGLAWGLILSSMLIISIGDTLYYEYTFRHLSSELFNMANDTNLIIEMAFNSYLLYTLLLTPVLLLITALFIYLFTRPIKNRTITPKSWFTTLLIIILLFFGVRSKLTGKSFGTSDAFAVNKVSSGNLALNGFFCVYRTRYQRGPDHNHMPFDEALETTKAMLASGNSHFTNSEVPIERGFKNPSAKPYNVVFILIESWGAEHLDSYTHYKPLGISPFFSKLSSEGVKFTNFYANGNRSIYGLTTLLTGLPKPSGYTPLGNGLEFSHLSYLGSIVKENGYSTLAMQGSSRRSYRIDSVMNLSGFDQYYGACDIPDVEELGEGRSVASMGTYDYNLMDYFHKKVNTLKEPFFTFAFTSTTHTDYHLPDKKYEKFPHGLKSYSGYMNAMYYTDTVLKRFMNEVKDEPWFDNTIFIFTGDHGFGSASTGQAKELREVTTPLPGIEHNRIPLLIYAPKIFKPSVNTALGSHADILPTVIDMLGLKNSYSSMGNSLLDQNVSERFVYLVAGNLISLITDEGYISHNYKSLVESNTTETEKLEQKLLSIDTVEGTLIDQNRWAR